MKRIEDAAFVVSVHEEVSPGALRINLRWRGNHEIFEFELARKSCELRDGDRRHRLGVD
jgi:hypothetical protein